MWSGCRWWIRAPSPRGRSIRCGSGPAILLLHEATADPDAMVRFAALNALGQLDSPRARAAVRAVSDSDDPRLRRLAERLVRRHRPEPAPVAPDPTDRPLPAGVVAAAPGVLVELACESTVLTQSRQQVPEDEITPHQREALEAKGRIAERIAQRRNNVPS